MSNPSIRILTSPFVPLLATLIWIRVLPSAGDSPATFHTRPSKEPLRDMPVLAGQAREVAFESTLYRFSPRNDLHVR